MSDKPWTAPGLSPQERTDILRKQQPLKVYGFRPDRVLEAIEAAVRDAAPKWTAVVDGMTIQDGRYIGVVEDEGEPGFRKPSSRTMIVTYINGIVLPSEVSLWGSPVTYIMPLPEPPREVTE